MSAIQTWALRRSRQLPAATRVLEEVVGSAAMSALRTLITPLVARPGHRLMAVAVRPRTQPARARGIQTRAGGRRRQAAIISAWPWVFSSKARSDNLILTPTPVHPQGCTPHRGPKLHASAPGREDCWRSSPTRSPPASSNNLARKEIKISLQPPMRGTRRRPWFGSTSPNKNVSSELDAAAHPGERGPESEFVRFLTQLTAPTG